MIRELAVVLSSLMIMVAMGQRDGFAQSSPVPQPELPGGEQSAPSQAQPLSADQLDQLVAPIALYSDALVAQVLTAATYPTQVVEANRWLTAQGNAPAEQIAAGANAQNWDASVKALTAFPSVLAQMDRNIRWTTDLGNAYYSQPQDVMDAVREMRQKAQTAARLSSTPPVNNTSEEGNWRVVESEDKMTAAKRVTFELLSDNSLRQNRDAQSRIDINCEDGKYQSSEFTPGARLGRPTHPGFWGQPQMEVVVRVDNAHNNHGWNWNGRFLAMDKGTVQELLGAQVFKIEFLSSHGPEIAEFSPSGIDLTRVSQACGLRPRVP